MKIIILVYLLAISFNILNAEETAKIFPIEIGGFIQTSLAYKSEDHNPLFNTDLAELVINSQKNGIMGEFAVDFLYSSIDSTASTVFSSAFIETQDKFLKNLTLTMGMFTPPIGAERKSPPDMYQYSLSLVSNRLIPTSFVGLMADYKYTNYLESIFYVVNGWDTTFSDNNDAMTFGHKFIINIGEENNIGLSTIYGPELDNNSYRFLMHLQTFLKLKQNWIIGADLNFKAKEKNIQDEWYGMMLMTHFDYCEYAGITLRTSHAVMPDKIKYYEFTTAFTFIVEERLLPTLEFRKDWEGRNDFFTIAFELIYTF